MSLAELRHQITDHAIYVLTPIASGAVAFCAMVDPSMLGSLVGSLGVSGILVWYVYYHVKYVNPRMEMRQDQRDIAIRNHYEKVIAKIEESDEKKNVNICNSLDRLSDCIDKMEKRISLYPHDHQQPHA